MVFSSNVVVVVVQKKKERERERETFVDVSSFFGERSPKHPASKKKKEGEIREIRRDRDIAPSSPFLFVCLFVCS